MPVGAPGFIMSRAADRPDPPSASDGLRCRRGPDTTPRTRSPPVPVRARIRCGVADRIGSTPRQYTLNWNRSACGFGSAIYRTVGSLVGHAVSPGTPWHRVFAATPPRPGVAPPKTSGGHFTAENPRQQRWRPPVYPGRTNMAIARDRARGARRPRPGHQSGLGAHCDAHCSAPVTIIRICDSLSRWISVSSSGAASSIRSAVLTITVTIRRASVSRPFRGNFSSTG